MTITPVTIQVEVPLDPVAAFRLFTDRIDTWWPLATHSVYAADAVRLHFPAHVGDQIVEMSSDGKTCAWGTLQDYDPPSHVRFTWHPRRAADTAQVVNVWFTATPDGTSVRLVHTGWEAAGRTAAELRANYATGWVSVLDAFTAAAPTTP